MASNLKDDHWTKEAVCKFDKAFLSFEQEVVERCKAMCTLCPVKVECNNWAEEIDAHFVAGGKSRYDRLKERWKRIEVGDDSNFR